MWSKVDRPQQFPHSDWSSTGAMHTGLFARYALISCKQYRRLSIHWTNSSRSLSMTSSRTAAVTGSDFALKWSPVCSVNRHAAGEPSVVSHRVGGDGWCKCVLHGGEERKAAIVPGESAEVGASGVEESAVLVLPDSAEVTKGDGRGPSLLPKHGHLRVDRFADEVVTEHTWVSVYPRFLVASWPTRHARTSPTLDTERLLGRIRPLTDAHHRK